MDMDMAFLSHVPSMSTHTTQQTQSQQIFGDEHAVKIEPGSGEEQEEDVAGICISDADLTAIFFSRVSL
jgi:hypothetical protein